MTSTINDIKAVYDKYIVAPINQLGLGGYTFDVEREFTSTLTANITDHFVEDNTTIQDHIALLPERITLNSQVGELVERDETSISGALQEAAQRLVAVAAYAPQLSEAEAQIRGVLDGEPTAQELIENTTLDDVANVWELVKNLNPGANRQQRAYLYFKALYESRTLLSVQTPYSFMQSMAIENITAVQPENTNGISSFSITLKQVRTASFELVPFDTAQYQGRTGQQREPTDNKGSTSGLSVDTSGAAQILDGLFR